MGHTHADGAPVMGYHMDFLRASFRLEKHKAALQALKGSGYNWAQEMKDCTTLVDAMGTQGWQLEVDDRGKIVGICFDGERLCDEDEIFDCLAPYVKAGSYIRMMGEDSEMWQWYFDGEKVVEEYPKISWPHGPDSFSCLR